MTAAECRGDGTSQTNLSFYDFLPARTAANAKKNCDQDLPGKGDAKFDLDSIISKLLIGVTPNLIWVTQRNKIDWKRLRKGLKRIIKVLSFKELDTLKAVD